MKNPFISGVLIVICAIAWVMYFSIALTGGGFTYWEFPAVMFLTFITGISILWGRENEEN